MGAQVYDHSETELAAALVVEIARWRHRLDVDERSVDHARQALDSALVGNNGAEADFQSHDVERVVDHALEALQVGVRERDRTARHLAHLIDWHEELVAESHRDDR